MKRMILLLGLPLLLTACATPRESCLRSATKEIAVVDKLILETQGNLQRGYAIGQEAYTSSRVDVCVGSGRYRYGYGGIGFNYCARPETRYRDKPVAIDPASERRKLADLKARRSALEKQAKAQIASCNTQYPATN